MLSKSYKTLLGLCLVCLTLTACSSAPAPPATANANQTATPAALPAEKKTAATASKSPSAAATNQSPEDQLKAIYANLDASLKNMDTKPLVAYLAKDYEVTSKDGKTLKGEAAVAAVQGSYEGIKELSEYRTAISTIEQIEGTYVVFNTVNAKGKMPFKGADAPFTIAITSEDHWVQDDQGNWQVTASVERKNQLTINGQTQK